MIFSDILISLHICKFLDYRERRRKERSKSKAKVDNGNETLSLLEKLQLAMEKCDGKFFNKNILSIKITLINTTKFDKMVKLKKLMYM